MSEPTLGQLNADVWVKQPLATFSKPDSQIYVAAHHTTLTGGLAREMILVPILLSTPEDVIGTNESTRAFVRTILPNVSESPNEFSSNEIFTGARIGAKGPAANNASVPLWAPDQKLEGEEVFNLAARIGEGEAILSTRVPLVPSPLPAALATAVYIS